MELNLFRSFSLSLRVPPSEQKTNLNHIKNNLSFYIQNLVGKCFEIESLGLYFLKYTYKRDS